MKKISILLLICIALFFVNSCTTPLNNERNTETTEIKTPIKEIQLYNPNHITLVVGETTNLIYEVYPYNTDENISISIGDNSIIKLQNNTIIAKSVGETYVSLKSPSNRAINQTITIKVINQFDKNAFEQVNGSSIRQASLTLCRKKYNKNWLGIEKDVEYSNYAGIIVRSIAGNHYFITSYSIFTEEKTHEYEEFYVLDYYNNQYTITIGNYHKYAGIALCSFTSQTIYPTFRVYEKMNYSGDFAITLGQNGLSYSRIESIGYKEILSSVYKSDVFYHSSSFDQLLIGLPVFNENGDIIGINIGYEPDRITAISSLEIKELLDSVFQ